MFDRFRHSSAEDTDVGDETAASPVDSTSELPRTREKPSRFHEAGGLESGTDGGWVDPYGPAPGFMGWWKLYWHDAAAFIFLGAIALWLLKWSPVPTKKFFTVTHLPTTTTADVVYPSFAHPKYKQIIGIVPDAMIAVFAPIITIIFTNLLGIGTYGGPGVRVRRPLRNGTLLFRRGSFWNANNGCMGVIYSVMTGATVQIIVKLVAPGLRPHFLTVCDPVLPLPPGEGYGGLYYTAKICRDYESRKDLIANAMQSFPSGHSVAAWAGLFYLSLYINGHFKVFANYHPTYWKLLFFVAPMVAATLVVGSLTLDMSHHWYDIVTGSLIGVGMALLSYRMVFASVWDYRWNHVPLLRGRELPGCMYTEEEMAQWGGGASTRQAGWGVRTGVAVGAPGDVIQRGGNRVPGAGAGAGAGVVPPQRAVTNGARPSAAV